jgi:hypothetical protein
MKATQGVDSALAPWLQALEKPRLSGLRTSVISGCTLANSSSTAMVPSVEALSTTTRRATTPSRAAAPGSVRSCARN